MRSIKHQEGKKGPLKLVRCSLPAAISQSKEVPNAILEEKQQAPERMCSAQGAANVLN